MILSQLKAVVQLHLPQNKKVFTVFQEQNQSFCACTLIEYTQRQTLSYIQHTVNGLYLCNTSLFIQVFYTTAFGRGGGQESSRESITQTSAWKNLPCPLVHSPPPVPPPSHPNPHEILISHSFNKNRVWFVASSSRPSSLWQSEHTAQIQTHCPLLQLTLCSLPAPTPGPRTWIQFPQITLPLFLRRCTSVICKDDDDDDNTLISPDTHTQNPLCSHAAD